MFSKLKLGVAAAVMLATLLVPCASASAAMTASTVTSPAGGAHLYSQFGTPTVVTFSGSATGLDPAGTINVVCLRRDKADADWFNFPIASTVDVDDATGAWTTDVDINDMPWLGSCLIRAVEAGAAIPANISTFTGPTVYFASLETETGSDGKILGWFVRAGLSKGYVALGSPWDYGVGASRLYSGTNLRESEFYSSYVAAPSGVSGEPFDSHSGIVVDGQYAYLPDSAAGESFSGTSGVDMPGLVGFTVDATHDATTGGVEVVETAPLQRCNADADQVTPTANCTSLESTGVSLQRTISESADGRTISIDESYSSLDFAPHTVQVQYYEGMGFFAPGTSFSFPWVSDGAFMTLAGAPFAMPPSAPWSWAAKVKSDSVDGDERFPIVARITSAMPTTFKQDLQAVGALLQIQTITVPAGGTTTLHQGMVAGTTKAAVDAGITDYVDSLSPPYASISSPADGATVDTVPMRVAGTASDNVGVASIKLNGAAVTLSGGSFSARFRPTVGANVLTLVAKDAAGNEKTVTSTFTYVPLNFNGTPGADILRGNTLANTLVGFGGADRISCGAGGMDTVRAGAGNDAVNCADRGSRASKKRSRDTINCGRGRRDRVVIDAFDQVRGCEVVTRI